MKLNILRAAVCGGLLVSAVTLSAADTKAKKPAGYPLETCVVSGEKLGSMGAPYVHQYKGQEVQFCCKGCLSDFNKEPAKFMKMVADAKPKPYTLTTCVVSDEKLGEMGEPVVHAYRGREIKFCCEGCMKDFNKEPAKFIKKIEAAEKQAKAKK